MIINNVVVVVYLKIGCIFVKQFKTKNYENSIYFTRD